MSNPLIYVGTHAIKPGMLDTARKASEEMVQFVEENHLRMMHFEIDIDEAAGEMTVVQIHPDGESLILHVQLAADRIRSASEFLEATTNIEIYGPASDELVGLINEMRGDTPARFNTAVAWFSRLE